MQETLNLLIGVAILLLGIPIGMLLAKLTKEELQDGKKYFKLIISISLLIGFAGLMLKNDIILFTFFFIAIVTSKSLK
jgi:hypothetical protein